MQGRQDELLDCKPYLDICKASRVNDYRNLYKKGTRTKAVQNVRSTYTRSGFPSLRVLNRNEGGKVIKAGTELLSNYSDDYIFEV